jgi:hypothetical protein
MRFDYVVMAAYRYRYRSSCSAKLSESIGFSIAKYRQNRIWWVVSAGVLNLAALLTHPASNHTIAANVFGFLAFFVRACLCWQM